MTEHFSATAFAEELKAAGMNHAQAFIIAKGLEASRNDLVTKADLAEAVQTLRAEIAAAEARMEKRMDERFLVFKAEIDVRFTQLEAKFEARIARIEAELVVMRWCFGLMFALQFGILAKLFFP